MPNVQLGGRVAKRCSGETRVGTECRVKNANWALSERANFLCGRGPGSLSKLKESCDCFYLKEVERNMRLCSTS